MKPDIQNIIKAVRMLEEIHQPEYRMRMSMENITALCDEIERLTPEGEINTMNKFEKELSQLINRHSVENIANMPDFILAEMICRMVESIGKSVKKTLDWHGVDLKYYVCGTHKIEDEPETPA